MAHWLSCLLISYLSFIGLISSVDSLIYDGLYSATALLNDSSWFGKATAFSHFTRYNKPDAYKQFGLGISTDIPHSKGYYDRKAAITGCMSKCLPTQYLSFTGVPLRIGRHDLSSLTKWDGVSSTSISYELLDGVDVTAVTFHAQKGWIEVTKYKSASKENRYSDNSCG